MRTEPSISNVSLGVVAGDINNILDKEHYADLIAPVQVAYEDEKARILGEVG